MFQQNKNHYGMNLIQDEDHSSFKLEIPANFLSLCNEADRLWNIDFKVNIAKDYPYTMSPETIKYIAHASELVKEQMSNMGLRINSWDNGLQNHEPYVIGVLGKVCVPETIEPIFDNTDKIVHYLAGLHDNNDGRIFTIRSFFTGAAVAEKCLISRMYSEGMKNFNLISTDSSAESIAVAAVNLQLWNESLPLEDRYDIHIVDGKIPENLYSANRTIVLQVGDALLCSQDEKTNFDALLLDHGLPYHPYDYGSKLVINICHNMGSDGLLIAILGLDAKIKVEISILTHFQHIVKACFSDVTRDPRIGLFQAPYNYPHYYDFYVKEDGSILITKVLSDGAGRTYNWCAKLLKNNFPKLIKVLKTMKNATDLSRVKDAVITSPFKSHCDIVEKLKANGYVFSDIERPLEYETFGWNILEYDRYVKEGKIVNGEELMELCRQQDPLVHRNSIFRVYHKPSINHSTNGE